MQITAVSFMLLVISPRHFYEDRDHVSISVVQLLWKIRKLDNTVPDTQPTQCPEHNVSLVRRHINEHQNLWMRGSLTAPGSRHRPPCLQSRYPQRCDTTIQNRLLQ